MTGRVTWSCGCQQDPLAPVGEFTFRCNEHPAVMPEQAEAALAAEKAAHIETLTREAEAARSANRMRDDIEAERDALQARLTAVLALHFARGRNILGHPVCNECSPLRPMPCPTVRAAASGQEG